MMFFKHFIWQWPLHNKSLQLYLQEVSHKKECFSVRGSKGNISLEI